MSVVKRVAAISLAVSALGGTGWMVSEGFAPEAMMPRPGDRWTYGYGSTFKADGTPVQRGDTITRADAQKLALGNLDAKYGECVRKSLGATLVSQVEFDTAADFTGNYGCAAWNASSMLREYKAANYTAACEAYLLYRFVRSNKNEGPGWVKHGAGWRYDCATPGNKICGGVWTRSQKRYSQCFAV